MNLNKSHRLREFLNVQPEKVLIFLYFLNIFRVVQCRIHSGDHEAFPVHSLVDDKQCRDHRLNANLVSIHKTIKLEYQVFRFATLERADQEWFRDGARK